MDAPVVVLVEPQIGENIGAAARAMGNFGLSRLRIVNPRQGWPNDKARMMAAGADDILERAEIFMTFEAAIADCHYVIAATARAHDQAKPVVSPWQAAQLAAPRVASGETVALVFGRERNGLENDEIALADAILTLPVNPRFRLAQSGAGRRHRRLRMVQTCDCGRTPLRDARQISARTEAADFCVLRISRSRTRARGIFPAA